MGSFSLVHWLLVILVVLLVFGPSKLASVGKGLGEGIRNFKKGLGGDGESSDEEPKQLADKSGGSSKKES
jgi:sec-independent protein translocase protein TatA